VKNTLQITKSKIVVSKNDRCDGGYFVQHKVTGILPGCRKEVVLSFSPMTGYVWVNPLFGYSGSASISPIDWLALVKVSPVEAERWHGETPIEITPELRAMAYADASRVADCPAIHSKDHHPDYKPKFNFLQMDKVNRG